MCFKGLKPMAEARLWLHERGRSLKFNDHIPSSSKVDILNLVTYPNRTPIVECPLSDMWLGVTPKSDNQKKTQKIITKKKKHEFKNIGRHAQNMIKTSQTQ